METMKVWLLLCISLGVLFQTRHCREKRYSDYWVEYEPLRKESKPNSRSNVNQNSYNNIVSQDTGAAINAVQQVQHTIQQVSNTPLQPESTAQCHRELDLVLIMDSSYSLDGIAWDEEKNTANALIDQLDVTTNGTHVAVLVFSTDVVLAVPFNTYKDADDLKRQVDSTAFINGWSRTDQALLTAKYRVLTTSGGSRTGIPKAVVVLTDGRSDGEMPSNNNIDWLSRLKTAADTLKQDDVHVFCIGTDDAETAELNVIASGQDHVFRALDINNLAEKLKQLSKLVCTEEKRNTSPPQCPIPSCVYPSICLLAIQPTCLPPITPTTTCTTPGPCTPTTSSATCTTPGPCIPTTSSATCTTPGPCTTTTSSATCTTPGPCTPTTSSATCTTPGPCTTTCTSSCTPTTSSTTCAMPGVCTATAITTATSTALLTTTSIHTSTSITTLSKTETHTSTAIQTATHTTTMTDTLTETATSTSTATHTTTSTDTTTQTHHTTHTSTATTTTTDIDTTTTTLSTTNIHLLTSTQVTTATTTAIATSTALATRYVTSTLLTTSLDVGTTTHVTTATLTSTAVTTATDVSTAVTTATLTSTHVATETETSTAVATATLTSTHVTTVTDTSTAVTTATKTATLTTTNTALTTSTSTHFTTATITATRTSTAIATSTAVTTATDTKTQTEVLTTVETSTTSLTKTATATSTVMSTSVVTSCSYNCPSITPTPSLTVTPSSSNTPQPPTPPPACNNTLEIGLIVDASDSMTPEAFTSLKNFLAKFISVFNVSPDGSHVGVITFAGEAQINVRFGQREFHDSKMLQDKIKSLKSLGKDHWIDTPLELAKTGLFTAADGHRVEVPSVLIVFTDKSGDTGKPYKDLIAPLVTKGITIIAVGLSNKIPNSELQEMANGFANNTFSVVEYGTLDNMRTDLTYKVCNTTLPDPGTKPCKAVVDLGFVVDGSDSISTENFAKCKDFVKNMAGSFEISQELSHVGVVVFSTTPSVVFNFKTHYNISSIHRGIDLNMSQPRGETNIGAAINIAKTDLYDASSRENVRRILIVMTDGVSLDAVKLPAQNLRDIGVLIYSLGIGKDYRLDQLNEMATDPDKNHVFTAGFDELDTMVYRIKDQACQEVKFTKAPPREVNVAVGQTVALEWEYTVIGDKTKAFTRYSPTWDLYYADNTNVRLAAEDMNNDWKWSVSPDCPASLRDRISKQSSAHLVISNVKPTDGGTYGCTLNLGYASPLIDKVNLLVTAPPCKAKVDLVFLIDGSGSIEQAGKGNFQRCLNFAKTIARNFDISKEETHVGAVVFSRQAKLEFNLVEYNDINSVEKAVDKIEYPAGGTYLDKGLEMVQQAVFLETGRARVPHVLIVMTDGQSSGDVATASTALKKAGTLIYALGVGNYYSLDQLKVIASTPTSAHVFASGFEDLEKVAQTIKNNACAEASEMPG